MLDHASLLILIQSAMEKESKPDLNAARILSIIKIVIMFCRVRIRDQVDSRFKIMSVLCRLLT